MNLRGSCNQRNQGRGKCGERVESGIKFNFMIAFTTLLARHLILLNWKRPVPPSHTRWLKEIMFYLKLEKIKYTLRGVTDTFERVWRPEFIPNNRLGGFIIPLV